MLTPVVLGTTSWMRFKQAAQAGRGADDVVLEMGAVDALVNGVFAHGDGGNFDVGLLAFLIIVVRPFAERPLVVAFMRRHDSFDNDLAARRHHEIDGFRFDHFQRLARETRRRFPSPSRRRLVC